MLAQEPDCRYPDPAIMISKLQLRLKTFGTEVSYMPWALRLVWRAASQWTSAWIALLILQSLLPVAVLYLTRMLVNGLVAALGQGGTWEALRPTIIVVVITSSILLLQEVLRSITGLVQTVQAELVETHVSDLIHAQALRLDLAYYETSEGYDRLYRAKMDALSRPVALIENLGAIVQNGLLLLAMTGLLLAYGLWLPVLLVVSALPTLFVVLQFTLRLNEWRMRSTPTRRRAQYFTWLITMREAAAEMRLFALGERFRMEFLSLRERLRSERIALARRQAIGETLAGGIGLLALAVALSWMVTRTMRGQVTLGDLALFYQAFSQGQRIIRTLLGSVSQSYSNSLFLENLHTFLAEAPRIVDPVQPVGLPLLQSDGIRFDHVSFCYPGSARTALDDFSLHIKPGTMVAIVGENGAGKSTLIKLLCRFYDPAQGRITWDGEDLRDLPLSELRGAISVLFQEPVHYHDTAGKNIAYGAIAPDPTSDVIHAAARRAGAHIPIERLPHGYETMLGKWFGGAELSVGEWQRVALARAFLRQASLVVLDEPTSAMDSWAEADWLARFREFVQGRTTIIITHRFTTALQADVIHVMADGRIAERGTHAELLALNGRYATSWHQQMRDSGVKDVVLSEIRRA
jgi:ATP-binding cassette subfamily B protein